jgi:3-deoxy-7-phosphoheptulonate synthase
MSSSARRQEPDRLKVGPTLTSRRPADPPDRHAEPENEPGRLTLIARMGADKVEQKLPALCAR